MLENFELIVWAIALVVKMFRSYLSHILKKCLSYISNMSLMVAVTVL